MIAKSSTLKEFLDKYKRLEVPLYQRGYSWDTKFGRILLEDIENCGEGKHFFGSIVVDAAGKRKYLIDGQQRLTTVFLLMAALHQTAKDKGEACGCAGAFLHNKGKYTLKLSLAERGRQAFEECMNQMEMSSAFKGSRIGLQYQYFLRYFSQAQELAVYSDTLMENFYVIDVELEDGDNANEIFESLNYKSEPLKAFDLVRNYLIMRMSEDEEKIEDDYDLYIQPMEDIHKSEKKREKVRGNQVKNTVKTEDYREKFVAAYVTCIKGENVASAKLYEEFKAVFDERLENGGEDVIYDCLDEWKEYGGCFQELINPEEAAEMDGRICDRLLRLEMTGTDTYYPLLLFRYVQFKRFLQENADVTREAVHQFVRELGSIETFIVRTVIGNSRALKSLNKIFSAAVGKMAEFTAKTEKREWFSERARMELENILVELSTNDKRIYIAENHSFAEMVREYSFYAPQNYSLCRLALQTIEEKLRERQGSTEKAGADFIQIEHIMPRNFSSTDTSWQKMLGEAYQQIHDRYINTIGNLTMLSDKDNLANSNNSFEEKKRILSESILAINREEDFAGRQRWGEDEMKNRGERLAGMLAEYWGKYEGIREESLQTKKHRAVTGETYREFYYKGQTYSLSEHGGAVKNSVMLVKVFETVLQDYPERVDEVLGKRKKLFSIRVGAGFRGYIHLTHDGVGRDIYVKVDGNLDSKLRQIADLFRLLDISPEEFYLIADDGSQRNICLSQRAEYEMVRDAYVFGERITGDTATDIYARAVELLLQKYVSVIGKMETYFTCDEQLASKYKGTNRECRIGGKTVYIKTGFSTKDKRNNLRRICVACGIDPDEVRF